MATPIIKEFALQAAARLLLSGHLWSTVRLFCTNAAQDENLDNAAKHAKVKSDLRFIFNEVSSILLNLAIELGTLYVQTQLEKQKS